MSYAALVAAHPPRVIRNETQYNRALRLIDELMGRDLSASESDYLDTLATLVEAYENDHHRITTAGIDGIDVLKYLLEQNQMSASDLGRLLGSRTLGSAILKRQRELSKNHLRTLCKRFNVSADLFLR